MEAKAPIFRPLSRFISLHEPPEPSKGQLIILATWLGGTKKHTAKYTSLYSSLAPNARILLIEAPLDTFLNPYWMQRRNIRPAIHPIAAVLRECGYIDKNPNKSSGVATPDTTVTLHGARPQILLHIFSNGGANNISQLLQVWKSEIGLPLPLSGVIIDSALAAGGPRQNYRGFQQSLPKGMVSSILGPIAVSYALLVLETSIALGRYPRPETFMRESVLDETLMQVDSSGETSSRNEVRDGRMKRICYFASKLDQNAPFQDVLSHAEEAKRKGWDVDIHLWDDTPHCNHLGKHVEEYMGAVRTMLSPIKAKL